MAKNTKTITVSVEEKLNALYELQKIDSSIDKIRIVRGELPLEIEDLNDTILGLDTRLDKFKLELSTIKEEIAENKNTVSLSNELIKKYEKQLKNIKNNREFNSLTKEIEFQNLEIELAEKKQKENQAKTLHKKDIINECQEKIDEKKSELDIKNNELDSIIKETEKEETVLLKKLKKAEKLIDERLLNGYQRIRRKVSNGLAVVSVERDACGGCFSQIPPQRQLDIKLHKKIIVCEHCGRIMIDSKTFEEK
jgi:predicted  nucleic acid-binding Zn-ribbon protein